MKKIQIGLPCSPSKLLKHSSVKAKEIFVSWGGGMGGASKTYYGEIIKSDKTTILIKTIDGEEIELYKSFIVLTKDVLLLTTVFDTTENANYNSKTVNKRIQTIISSHKLDTKFDFIDKYQSSDTLNKVLVEKEDS